MPRWTPFLLLGNLLIPSAAGAACVCYRDLETDNVYRNCGEPFIVLAFPQVICIDPAGEAVSYRFLGRWEHLPDTACDCGPAKALPNRPRGEDDELSAPSGR